MLSIAEFSNKYPQFCLDFTMRISEQQRVYDHERLANLPEELAPSHEFRMGGRGRPNLNQTLTHRQCTNCHKVLRNDFFYAPPSIMKRNGVFTNCLTCQKAKNSDRYKTNSSAIRRRRVAIWTYLAPKCAICGFDKHISAMDMHHIEAKEDEIATLITDVTLVPNSHRMEILLREASCCIALCSNCHRMLHARVLDIDLGTINPLTYKLLDLAKILDKIGIEDEEPTDE